MKRVQVARLQTSCATRSRSMEFSRPVTPEMSRSMTTIPTHAGVVVP
jgi:hypothetical protein